MSDCNSVSTPFDSNVKLEKRIDKPTQDEQALPYRELVESLTYLASSTRPDIVFSASYLGQFNNCFDETHWKTAKRVLRYLKGTRTRLRARLKSTYRLYGLGLGKLSCGSTFTFRIPVCIERVPYHLGCEEAKNRGAIV